MPKQIVKSDRVANPVGSFSLGTRTGPLMFLSAQAGIDPGTGRLVTSCAELRDEIGPTLAMGRLAADSWSGPVQAQCWQMFQNIRTICEEQGASLQDILRINMWMTDFSDLPALMPVRSRPFAPHDPPPITNIETSALCVPGAQIQAEVIVALPREGGKREGVGSPRISQAVGHYMVAARTGQAAFAAGMIAARNDTGRVVERYEDLGPRGRELASGRRATDEIEERVAAQSFAILEDTRAVLEDGGASFADVVKTTIYLKQMRDLPAWERVYRGFFADNPPPTTIVGCTELGVSRFTLEIECSVLLPGPERREMVTTSALPVCTHAASLSRSGNLLFLSGQFGIDPATGRMVRGYGDLPSANLASGSVATDWREGPAAAQTVTILENTRRALEEQGTSLENLLKLNVYLTDARDIPAIERVAARYFPTDAPACGIVEVPSLPLRDAVVQIDGIALLA
ncbi:MAG: hypothetical protein IT307_18375 [Chloroflexi bacterium]|nr:hypothetical protein [Chloroflexota bacterium]